MKPISLRFKCFGPFVGEQRIDFTKLTDSSFFLISGDTGAGKTTILEAISYSLYGKSSGGLRDDLEVMRCDKARNEDPTEIEFIFEINGNRYKFHREVKFGRSKFTTTLGCEIWRNDVWEPLFENPKATVVNKKAEEIIGLSYEQFCQVVILPQGKFEQLLVSNSTDKEEILTSIFHAEKWNRIVEYIKNETTKEKNRLSAEFDSITLILSSEDCSSVEELKDKLNNTEKAYEDSKLNVSKLTKEKGKATSVYENAIKTDGLFSTLEDSSKNYESLKAKKKVIEDKCSKLEVMKKADLLRVDYSEYSLMKKRMTELDHDLKECDKDFTDSKTAKEKVEKDKRTIAEKKPDYDKAVERRTLLEASQNIYQSIDNKKKTLEEAQLSEKDALKSFEVANSLFEKAKTDLDKAIDESNQAAKVYSDQVCIYDANVAGHLAQNLVEGTPCPVCGSKSHPHLAVLCSDVNVNKDTIDAALEASQKARENVELKQEIMNSKSEALNKATTDKDKAVVLSANAKADYEASKKSLIEGIEDIQQLISEINKVKGFIKRYEDESDEVTQRLSDSEQQYAACKKSKEDCENRLKSVIDEFNKLNEEFISKLNKDGFCDVGVFLSSLVDIEIIDSLSQEITDYKSNLESAKKQFEKALEAVKDIEKPDLDVLKNNKLKSEELLDKAQETSFKLKNDAQRLDKLNTELTNRWNKYNSEIKISESNQNFAELLNPRSGLSLQRYVLGVMFSSIIGQANELLKSAWSGRYELRKSSESTNCSRKSGLELNVFDNDTGCERSVKTLSGGEKFIVSLCLAIGLSTVVQTQSGGTKLDSMFIDEGFGTLDDDCLFAALTILGGVRQSHAMVGIISHIDKLQEHTTSRIDVKKSDSGNEIVLVR